MVSSVDAVLQARKVYKDLHQAYSSERVIQVLKDWLEENNTLAYEHNLAIEELGWLYGTPLLSESLYQIHKLIEEKNLGEDVESIRAKPEPIPSEPSAENFSEDLIEKAFEEGSVEDVVNHPKHYQLANGVEAIELMELTSTAPEFVGHLRNTALKYIIRAGHKDPSKYVQDLDKAKWYITKLQEFHTKCEEKEY